MGIAAFMVVGCGSSSDKWGIDNSTEVEVSHGPLDKDTGLYRCEFEDATLVQADSVVRPITDDTKIRVWHYQDTQKYVCTLKGQAVLAQTTKGV